MGVVFNDPGDTTGDSCVRRNNDGLGRQLKSEIKEGMGSNVCVN